MPVALVLLAVAADPAVPVVVKPPELPPTVRDRVRELAAVPLPRQAYHVVVSADGVLDTTARPLHLQELAELDLWLTLRPDDEPRRRRAIRLAETVGDKAAEGRHEAALRGALVRLATAYPRSADARVRLARCLFADNRLPEAAAVAGQATRLVPGSADGWRVLGKILARGGDWPAALHAFDTAADLAPADWRVPAARAEEQFFSVSKRGPGRPVTTAEWCACELDRQTSVRLGAADPACLRSSVGLASGLAVFSAVSVGAAAPDWRPLASAVPALAQAADHDPIDVRLVAMVVAQEVMTRPDVDDLLPNVSAGRRLRLDRLPPADRHRIERWLRRSAARVAADNGPEAAEAAVTASRLFALVGWYDQAVAAAGRAAALRPATPYCEEALQMALVRSAGRAGEALARCRAGGAGRPPADEVRFEVNCLQTLGRWDEARRVAEAGVSRDPGDTGLGLAAVGCRLHRGTPDGLAAAGVGLDEVWSRLAARPPADDLRQEATRLRVLHLLLTGRFTDADALLDRCRREKQPVRDDAELTAAARPYLWPKGEVVPAAAVDVVPVTGSKRR